MKKPETLDPLEEEDVRRYVELFRDERSYSLQKDRMHAGVEVIKERYDRNAEQVKPTISRLVSFAKKMKDGLGRQVVEIIQAMAELLEQFTYNTVSFVMESVDHMAEYIECKTDNYHRLLVVLSQEVQDNMDAYKAVHTTNILQCRELEDRISVLQEQLQELKADMLTLKLRDMRDALHRHESLRPPCGFVLGTRTAPRESGHSTPSQTSSVASSFQESMHRQNMARNMMDIPVMIREAQVQAELYRGGTSLDGFD